MLRAKMIPTILVIMLTAASPLLAQEGASGTGSAKTEIKPDRKTDTKNEKGKDPYPAIVRNTFMLGIGNLAVFKTGGGDTNEGSEFIGINSTAPLPTFMISPSFFVIDGLSLGLLFNFAYIKQKFPVNLGPLQLSLSGTDIDFDVGPVLAYYFKASEKFYPYLGVMFTYGQSIVQISKIDSKYRIAEYQVGIMAGMVFMVAPHLGINVELSHIRDIEDLNGEKRNGHITGLNVGFKIFI